MQAAIQQGIPLQNSLRNVYLHTPNMLGWSQSNWGGGGGLMGISCKCSALCMLRCKLENTGVQRCNICQTL